MWRPPGCGGPLVVEAPWVWRPPGCGGPLVVEAPCLWRPPGCGGPLVVETLGNCNVYTATTATCFETK